LASDASGSLSFEAFAALAVDSDLWPSLISAIVAALGVVLLACQMDAIYRQNFLLHKINRFYLSIPDPQGVMRAASASFRRGTRSTGAIVAVHRRMYLLINGSRNHEIA
jgi:hypothetical protein